MTTQLEQAKRAKIAETPRSLLTDFIEVLRIEVRRLEEELQRSHSANSELRISNEILSRRVLEAGLPKGKRT